MFPVEVFRKNVDKDIWEGSRMVQHVMVFHLLQNSVIPLARYSQPPTNDCTCPLPASTALFTQSRKPLRNMSSPRKDDGTRLNGSSYLSCSSRDAKSGNSTDESVPSENRTVWVEAGIINHLLISSVFSFLQKPPELESQIWPRKRAPWKLPCFSSFFFLYFMSIYLSRLVLSECYRMPSSPDYFHPSR